jgi:hypothetical protein
MNYYTNDEDNNLNIINNYIRNNRPSSPILRMVEHIGNENENSRREVD